MRLPLIARLNRDRIRTTGEGTIYSFTKVSREAAGTEFVDNAPYYTALVAVDGRLATMMLTDFDQEPRIDQPVEIVTRHLYTEGDRDRGVKVYGPKARPAWGKES